MLLVPGLNYIYKNVGIKRAIIFTWLFTYLCFRIFSSPLADIGRATFFYYIGIYLRQNNRKRNRSGYVLLAIFSWLCSSTAELLILLMNSNGVVIPHAGLFSKGLSFVNSGLFIPACAISIFIFAIKLNFSSKRINTLASTMFGVYLLTDGYLTRYLLWEEILNIKKQYMTAAFPIITLIDLIAVFAVSVLLDYFIRQKFIDKIVVKKNCNVT